jgi:hypothetical protein
MPGTNTTNNWSWDFSMLATFDGKGGFSGSSLYDAYDSDLFGPYSFTGGTYHVNPDCTVCLTIPANGAFDSEPAYLNGTVTDSGGDEAAGTSYSDGEWSGTFDAKRIHEGMWNFFE